MKTAFIWGHKKIIARKSTIVYTAVIKGGAHQECPTRFEAMKWAEGQGCTVLWAMGRP